MKIIVFDVPAVDGGALAVLKYLEKEVKEDPSKDVEWIFITSKPFIKEEVNVKNVRFPWIKKSWFHRLFFDFIIAPQLVKKYEVDKIVSLQNLIIPRTKIKQYVYIHQSLPFSKIRFSLIGNRKMWIYQNLIGYLIFNSIKKSHKVIVQTEWMKIACNKKNVIDKNNIEVIRPNIDIDVKRKFKPTAKHLSTFFFPAGAYEYKNHSLIIDACKKIHQKYKNNYQVIFTINGDENENAIDMKRDAEKYQLNIKFVGNLSRAEVFEQYSKSVLLFPSYIETFGLPLLEARLHHGIILAADTDFSKEVLNGYENSFFFDPFNSQELSELMIQIISQKVCYREVKGEELLLNNNLNTLKDVILFK